MHRQLDFWDLLVPDFATPKLPIIDPNSFLCCNTHPEVELARGDVTALTATTAEGQQTWWAPIPAPPPGSLRGHTTSTLLCFCAFGELALKISIWQTYNCNQVGVFLGRENAKHLQGWQNYQPCRKAIQLCMCPIFLVRRPGSILTLANSGVLPVTSTKQYLLCEARETLPLGCGVSSLHQGWQKKSLTQWKVHILLQMSVLGEKN